MIRWRGKKKMMCRSFGRSSRGFLRSVGSGMGGVQDSLSIAKSNPPSCVSLSSSSSVTPPLLAAPTGHGWHSTPCFFDEDDWEPIEEEEEADNGVSEYFVFGPIPSREEVESAVSAIQQVSVTCPQFSDNGSPSSPSMETTAELTNSTDLTHLHSSDESESKSDWIEPAPYLYYHDAMQSQVWDAFRLLQINPSVQRMVISLSSDETVWNAVMNNEVVQEVRESFYAAHAAEKDQSLRSDESLAAVAFLRWMFNNTKAKIMVLINNISKLVNDLFGAPDKQKAMGGFGGTLRSSLMLSVLVLIVIVVTRVRKA